MNFFKNKKTPNESDVDLSVQKRSKILTQTLDEGIHEYVHYLNSPFKIFFLNLLVGVARGFGIILGMTVVVALFVFIINLLGGLPVVGDAFQWLGSQMSQGVPGGFGR